MNNNSKNSSIGIDSGITGVSNLIFETDCHHKFHTSCLNEWMHVTHQNICPSCDHEIHVQSLLKQIVSVTQLVCVCLFLFMLLVLFKYSRASLLQFHISWVRDVHITCVHGTSEYE